MYALGRARGTARMSVREWIALLAIAAILLLAAYGLAVLAGLP